MVSSTDDRGDSWSSSAAGCEQTDHQTLCGLDRFRTQDPASYDVAVTTLRTYLDCFGDVTEASARLVVHPNTLRYRLRRLAESTGVDLKDPDERLLLQLRLRLADG